MLLISLTNEEKNLEKPEDIHAVGFRKMQTKYFSNFYR